MSDTKETKKTTELSKVLDFDSKDVVKFERTSGTKVPSGKTTPNSWLEAWFSLNEVEFCYDGNHSLRDDTRPSGRRDVNNETLYNYIFVGSGISGGKDVRPLIRPFIYNWEEQGKAKVKRQMIDRVSFKPELKESDLIEKYVEAMTGKRDPVDIAVIENFIYSVKRKMRHKDVIIDLFPILQGKQNSGKSTAVRKLLSPIDRFWTDRTLDILNQEKNLKVLGTKFVIFFDEMARAKKADVDAVKKHTTGKTVNYRRYYSQEEVSMRNISTFIGCTNRPVSEIFYDPTGARRFYEFLCLDKMDWEVISEIDYLKLWQSVDENMPNPSLIHHTDELHKRQALIRSMDSVEEFVSFEGLIPVEGEETMEVSFSDLYTAYSKWVTNQKMSGHFKQKTFAIRLSDLGIELVRKRDGRFRVIRKCDFYKLLPQK